MILRKKENKVTEIKGRLGNIQQCFPFSYAGEKGNMVLENINLSIKSGGNHRYYRRNGFGQNNPGTAYSEALRISPGAVLRLAVWMSVITAFPSFVTQWQWSCRKNVLFSVPSGDNLRWGHESTADEEIIEACKNCAGP